MGYQDAWDIQLEVHEDVMAGREDVLLFVEHDPVLTLGANFHEENLLLTPEQYKERGIDVIRTDRGGDVTYHGPGQLVIYPIFNVANHGKDLHKWMRDLEETMILTCASLGIEAHRKPDVNTGAWVGNNKIAAIGVKVRKWVNLHGIALNIDPDLSAFQLINPCGIVTHGVTSVVRESEERDPPGSLQTRVCEAFSQVFGAPRSHSIGLLYDGPLDDSVILYEGENGFDSHRNFSYLLRWLLNRPQSEIDYYEVFADEPVAPWLHEYFAPIYRAQKRQPTWPKPVPGSSVDLSPTRPFPKVPGS